MVERIAALRSLMGTANVDALLISDMVNIRYFSGFTGSAGMLLLTEVDAFFLTDGRYKTQADHEVTCAKKVIYKKRIDAFEEIIRKEGIRSVGFESKCLSYYEWNEIAERIEGIKLISLKDEIRWLRSLKNSEEIDIIKAGASLAKEAFIAVLDQIKPGAREVDVAFALEMEIRKGGADKVSFDIIVVSGERSALPHALPGKKEIEDGDLVIIDFGAVLGGYHTDETCTLLVGGVCEEAGNIYNIVRDAHDRAIEAVRPGVRAADIDKVARDYIAESGYGEYFCHGTGHGVGLDIHELPVISEHSDDILEEGMVFTVEPGIYLPELGGVRIEDMVLVTAQGPEVITQCNSYLVT